MARFYLAPSAEGADLTANSPLSIVDDVISVDLSSYYTSTETDSNIGTAIANLVDTAPETLDTLNELAFALGDDPNFATTVTNQIAGKADAIHTHAISDVADLQTELDGKLSAVPAGTMKLLSSGFDLFSISTLGGGGGTYGFTIPSFSSTKKVIAHISFLGEIDINPGDVSTFGVYIGSNGSNGINVAKVQTEEQNSDPMIVSGSVHKPFNSGLTASNMWLFHFGNKDASNANIQVSYAFYEIE